MGIIRKLFRILELPRSNRTPFVAFLLVGSAILKTTALDLTHAIIVAPANLSKPEQKAVTMLSEEVEKRSQIKWEVSSSWPSERTAIAVGSANDLRIFAGAYADELARENWSKAAD